MLDKKTYIYPLIIFSVAYCILYNFYMISFYSAGGDSAGLVQVLTSLNNGEGMVSSAFSSIYSLLPYLSFDLSQYINADFQNLHSSLDFTQWHLYLIAYPLSYLHYLGLSSLQIVSGFMSLVISGVLYIIYVMLKLNNVSILHIALFILALLFYAPFIGHIFGQFYFDRFFIFFELLLLVLLYQKLNSGKRVDLWIIIIFIITALISERPALFASLSIIYFILIYWKKISFKKDIYLFILPVIGFIYVLIYMKYIQNSIYYSNIDLNSILANLRNSFDFTSVIGQKNITIIVNTFTYAYIVFF